MYCKVMWLSEPIHTWNVINVHDRILMLLYVTPEHHEPCMGWWFQRMDSQLWEGDDDT